MSGAHFVSVYADEQIWHTYLFDFVWGLERASPVPVWMCGLCGFIVILDASVKARQVLIELQGQVFVRLVKLPSDLRLALSDITLELLSSDKTLRWKYSQHTVVKCVCICRFSHLLQTGTQRSSCSWGLGRRCFLVDIIASSWCKYLISCRRHLFEIWAADANWFDPDLVLESVNDGLNLALHQLLFGLGVVGTL